MAALALASCTGSVVSSELRAIMPAVPAHLKACFRNVQLPKDASDAKSARELIVKLRKSELAKTRCGKQAIAFYETQKARIEGEKK